MAKKKAATGTAPLALSSNEYQTMREDLFKKLGTKVAFGEHIDDTKLTSISTGSLKLDWALGTPLVEGSINEVYGAEQTGKTTIALEASASAIAQGRPVFFFDLERKLRETSLNMIKGLSGDRRKLFTRIRPDTGEEAVDLVHDCIMDFPGCFIVFDSVSAMMPEVEGAESASKQSMGKVAKLCWTMLRKNLGPTERNGCVILFISHISPKLNMYQAGDNKKGGKAISNLASQVIKLKRLSGDILKDTKGNPYGQMTQCEVIKNNMARPFRKVNVPIIWGQGINKALDLAQLVRDLCIIEYKNGWYLTDYEDRGGEVQRMREADFLKIIREDEEYRNSLITQVKELLG
ncbi:MAG: hypothetical protein ACXABY_02205 [Candidatus Thorarchaeota archaeon]|jgi:recombination protein RecA